MLFIGPYFFLDEVFYLLCASHGAMFNVLFPAILVIILS
jgi:hypothetical protein